MPAMPDYWAYGNDLSVAPICRGQVIAIYPITPSTGLAEAADAWSAKVRCCLCDIRVLFLHAGNCLPAFDSCAATRASLQRLH